MKLEDKKIIDLKKLCKKHKVEKMHLVGTGTSMFVYTLTKAVNKKYLEIAEKGFDGLLKNLIAVEENGLVNLNKCCGVAGLSGNPYGDGFYEYYINEIMHSNDPKEQIFLF